MKSRAAGRKVISIGPLKVTIIVSNDANLGIPLAAVAVLQMYSVLVCENVHPDGAVQLFAMMPPLPTWKDVIGLASVSLKTV